MGGCEWERKTREDINEDIHLKENGISSIIMYNLIA